jgi:hypothetical protein
MLLHSQRPLLVAERMWFWKHIKGVAPHAPNGFFFQIDGRLENTLYGKYVGDDYAISTPPIKFRGTYSYSALSDIYISKPNSQFSIVYNAIMWKDAVSVPSSIKYGDVLFLDSNIESHSRQVSLPSYLLPSKAMLERSSHA